MTNNINSNREHMRSGVSSVKKIGNLVFVSGQVSFDRNRALIGKEDIEVQTKQVFTNIEKLLDSVGSQMSDVAKITAYLINSADYPAYTLIRSQTFAEPGPASATVIVKELVDPELLVEIEAIAILS